MSDFIERISKLSPKRLALLAVDLHAKLERLEQRESEPIAVIGMGCRFPGGVTNPESYWKLLTEGRTAISEIPPDRWAVEDYYDPNPETPGKMATRWGGFIDGVDRFDASFFGIAPIEAVSLDPQQRILLEIACEALENAAQAPEGLMGSRTGVFIGMSGGDYYQLVLQGSQRTRNAYLVSGSAPSMAAGRISYHLGLHGPSFVLDTACSSSLVAIHLACQSLRAGECTMALAGGTSLILAPETMIGLSQAKMLSPDGRCRTFDAGANGIVRGEGCGVVVLKRLCDAREHRDRVLAVIRGTAINQDGRSSGLTAPNGPAQEAVIREALVRSGVKPGQIDYIETHGTGTTLGDPIEVRSLGAVFDNDRAAEYPLRIGSVKTNFGHLEFAAGVAGLIKVVLSLQHGMIPPHLHLQKPNPYIEWDRLPIVIPTELTPWIKAEGRRFAGVSSFGFSGTNAHIVLEEEPVEKAGENKSGLPHYPLALSAKNEAALKELAGRYVNCIGDPAAMELADLCFTANVGRTHFKHRIALLAASAQQARDDISAYLKGDAPSGMAVGGSDGSKTPEVVFLFTGQGCQYPGMGRVLYETHPLFRRTLDQCDEILRPYLERPLLSIIHPPAQDDPDAAKRLEETAFAQPALFAVEYALAQLWRSWGVEPMLVAGHSVGEYVAACVAGLFSLEDGLRLIAKRGELMQSLPAGGAMAAVFANPEVLSRTLDARAGFVSIAAHNGPENTVISGPAGAVGAILEELENRGIRYRRLKVSHAFHSALVEPMLDAFEATAAKVSYQTPKIGIVSNLTGKTAASSEMSNPAYWRRHARQPVAFLESMQHLYNEGGRLFVEIGPDPVLSGMASQFLPGESTAWHPSLRKNQNDWSRILQSLGALYAGGVDIDWEGFHRPFKGNRISLPVYPFQRKRYWIEPAESRDGKPDGMAPAVWREWLFEYQWEPQPAETAVPDYLPSNAKISAKIAPELGVLTKRHGADVYDEFIPLLDRLCAAYIVQALKALGLKLQQGDTVSEDRLVRDFGVSDRYRRLVGRLLDILAEDGMLRRAGTDWTVAETPQYSDPESLTDRLTAQFPQCLAELTMTRRCAGALDAVLQGARDPMELLFPDGSLEQTEKVYQESPSMRLFNTLIQKVVSSAVEALPLGRKLKVLEIGAGTGGTTAHILPVLPAGATHYAFSDISETFLKMARIKFSAYSFLEYGLLDISRDPRSQGWGEGRFDIVLAANVIHATADIRRALANIRKLLSPDGMLVLLETTVPQRFGDLTVGLTPGWWAYTDNELRPDYALLSAEKWKRLLGCEGFDDVTVVPDSIREETVLNQQCLAMARLSSAKKEAVKPAVCGTAGAWLVLADQIGIGHQLKEAMAARGQCCILVSKTNAFESKGEYYGLDPERIEDYRRMVDLAFGDHRNSCLGVVHLWSLDESLQEATTAAQLDAAGKNVCGSLVCLVQALAGCNAAATSRIVLITRGAQPVSPGDGLPAIVQAPLWGLGKVLGLEHPEFHCTMVDLDPESNPKDAAAQIDRILVSDSDDQRLAFRSGKQYSQRIVPIDASSLSGTAARISLLPDACYLITGGLSGLGLLLAERLVGRGARHLALVGRRRASEEAEKAIARLKATGAKVTNYQCDVADYDKMAGVFQAIARSSPPLRGIFHCAGETDDGVLLQQNWSRFRTVMAAKVAGSWNLHCLSRGMLLDYFVLYSSGASFMGSAGQGNHAAANAFMDVLAHYRRRSGKPGLSINWGPWKRVGAATRGDVIERMQSLGIGSIEPEQGLEILEHLLASGRLQVGVFPMLRNELPGARSIAAQMRLRDCLDTQTALKRAAHQPRQPEPSSLNEIRGTKPEKARNLLRRRLEQEAIRTLGLDTGERIDPGLPLRELGLDSLMAVQLRNAVSQLVGASLPATLLFNYPSLGQLSDFLADEVLRLNAVKTNTEGTETAQTSLDVYSEDELARLLAEKIDELDV